MGKLYYGASGQATDIPDRLLAHIKVVTATKLRRGESFTLTWQHRDDDPMGRTTLWLQPAIELRFVFCAAEPEKLDSALLQRFANQAGSSSGLVVDLAEFADDEDTPVLRALQSA